ncbi:hypothetical protein BBI11_07840 [Planococcus maritimus]|uniref:prepilin-type N-terminal cleavage/methylation domain-containing protein n=1 Tax=Planococcus maritimus TaxID=192421 RepID=UPI00080EF6A7|nr:prepilin-type N-terminal cleavage/methylation domain-containing protein [Planococcus maritimus]ANU16936.1 hypothetical protein BBI11_07840 [Planococcus maritimus]
MKKFIQNKLKDQKGLTLIELLAVIVILAIIAAIAIPAIGNIIENSRVGAAKSDLTNAISAAELYIVDNPTSTTVTLDNLKTGNYLPDQGSITSFSYAVTSKLVTGVALNDDITITATAATKAQISSIKNNDPTNTTKGTGTNGATLVRR